MDPALYRWKEKEGHRQEGIFVLGGSLTEAGEISHHSSCPNIERQEEIMSE